LVRKRQNYSSSCLFSTWVQAIFTIVASFLFFFFDTNEGNFIAKEQNTTNNQPM
jgi:hypothetical protein